MFYVCVHCRAVLFFDTAQAVPRHCGDTPMEAITISARTQENSYAGGTITRIETEISIDAGPA